MSEQEPRQRREVYYSGRVQGVGFRYTVQHIASGYQVGGYVKNLFDGRVLVVAEGPPAELDRFLAAIQGRMGRYISGVQETASPASSGFTEFEIRF